MARFNYNNHCILINTTNIISLQKKINSIKKIDNYKIFKIDWSEDQLKNNFKRLIKIFKSEEYFKYDSSEDLYLLFFELNKYGSGLRNLSDARWILRAV